MHATANLTAIIKQGSTFNLNSHVNTVLVARHQDAFSRGACYEQQFDSLLSDFNAFHQRAIFCAKRSEYFCLIVCFAPCREPI